MKKKGQGSFISGDMPSIIMIVLSIGFFLSSIYMANNDFQGKKSTLDMEAALVDATSVFLKENAKIRFEDLESSSGAAAAQLTKLERNYGVNVYVELKSLADADSGSLCLADDECVHGTKPGALVAKLSKRFPIALKGDTDLDVYPALVRVTVYR
jgi:hypothetical protein